MFLRFIHVTHYIRAKLRNIVSYVKKKGRFGFGLRNLKDDELRCYYDSFRNKYIYIFILSHIDTNFLMNKFSLFGKHWTELPTLDQSFKHLKYLKNIYM